MKEGGASMGIIWINKKVLLIQIIFEFKRFDGDLNSKDLVNISQNLW